MWEVVMEPEPASAHNNPTPHISPALKDCYDRWSQSHRLNELHGNFRTIAYRLYLYVYIYYRTERVVAINQNVYIWA